MADFTTNRPQVTLSNFYWLDVAFSPIINIKPITPLDAAKTYLIVFGFKQALYRGSTTYGVTQEFGLDKVNINGIDRPVFFTTPNKSLISYSGDQPTASQVSTTNHCYFEYCFTYDPIRREGVARKLTYDGQQFYVNGRAIQQSDIVVLVNSDNQLRLPQDQDCTFYLVPLIDYIAELTARTYLNYANPQLMSKLKLIQDAAKVELDQRATQLRQLLAPQIQTMSMALQYPIPRALIASSEGLELAIYPYSFWHLLKDSSIFYQTEFADGFVIDRLPWELFGVDRLPAEVLRDFIGIVIGGSLPELPRLMDQGASRGIGLDIDRVLKYYLALADYFGIDDQFANILQQWLVNTQAELIRQ
jgi:hypothetical protein